MISWSTRDFYQKNECELNQMCLELFWRKQIIDGKIIKTNWIHIVVRMEQEIIVYTHARHRNYEVIVWNR